MFVTHEEAIAEVQQSRISDPDATWIATQRGAEWMVVRLGLKPTKVTGTAMKAEPEPPASDPYTAIVRATWYAGSGG